jgi:hypothetical protein
VTSLLASLAALALSPGLDRVFRGKLRAEALLDGFVLVVVTGLLLLHVVPLGLKTAGVWSLIALITGIFAGNLPHSRVGAEIAVVALGIHGLLDGMALTASSGEGDGRFLGWAVILHTLPVGLATWRVAVEKGGIQLGMGLIGLSMLCTSLGWFGADWLLARLPGWMLGVLQCGVAGMLLHVLSHLGEGHHRSTGVAGGFLGLLVTAALAFSHPLPMLEIAPGSLPSGLLPGLRLTPALLVGFGLFAVFRTRFR